MMKLGLALLLGAAVAWTGDGNFERLFHGRNLTRPVCQQRCSLVQREG